LLKRQPFEVGRQVIVKVGYSNNPVRRCEDHNEAFPPASQLRWKLIYHSRAFKSGTDAKAAEDLLKATMAQRSESLGGEFFLCTEEQLSIAFASATQSTAQVVIRT
jgi:hypothetical protein